MGSFDLSSVPLLTSTLLRVITIQEGRAELFENTHPDPYCVPFMPGGSLFMRNPPPPLEICFPDGNYPADAPKVTLNPDMSICRPETGKNAVGSVLVDFGKKNME
jgi:NADH dehydrogenase (ubiquinone) 1 beta subcomplex subunit 9